MADTFESGQADGKPSTYTPKEAELTATHAPILCAMEALAKARVCGITDGTLPSTSDADAEAWNINDWLTEVARQADEASSAIETFQVAFDGVLTESDLYGKLTEVATKIGIRTEELESALNLNSARMLVEELQRWYGIAQAMEVYDRFFWESQTDGGDHGED